MAPKIQTPLPPMALNSIGTDRRPRPDAAPHVNRDQLALTALVKNGLIDGCGSLKSAAISMEMDQGQLTRELQDEGPRIGKLAKLEPTERAKVFDRLHERFGSAAEDPKVRLRRAIRELRAKADDVAELLERIA